MEIERKWLLEKLPEDIGSFPPEKIVQGYICKDPVIRIRRISDRFYLTVKGRGLMTREEFEIEISKEAFDELKGKCSGRLISKTRYKVPINNGSYIAEIDVFNEPHAGLILCEVEFSSEEEALGFVPLKWFGREVTYDAGYSNAALSDPESGKSPESINRGVTNV